MQEKQKVTLYIPPHLHRQLKIQAAVTDEPMSSLAEKAIDFYLSHPEVVEEFQAHGQTHQIHHCPACETSLVMRDSDLVALGSQPTVLPGIAEDLVLANPRDVVADQGEEALIPC
ncbi:hypothetical protein IQ266_25335 [filamentous cyanobacterium LEGE 11480]|uniref:Uncharacterized protein n=1 Tax=Romeriopsis navalis LEGE 11480 TaxID=2777977 RepID=A0A928Z7D0_9CYAN|nr:hypothetical protein [Romeriopsis navalis]MBE9033065.1 hypothetical protein [Romeriopsis navalis LEGE 11480]